MYRNKRAKVNENMKYLLFIHSTNKSSREYTRITWGFFFFSSIFYQRYYRLLHHPTLLCWTWKDQPFFSTILWCDKRGADSISLLRFFGWTFCPRVQPVKDKLRLWQNPADIWKASGRRRHTSSFFHALSWKAHCKHVFCSSDSTWLHESVTGPSVEVIPPPTQEK